MHLIWLFPCVVLIAIGNVPFAAVIFIECLVFTGSPPSVFHNAHANFAVFHVLYRARVDGTVKKSDAFVIVNVVSDIG